MTTRFLAHRYRGALLAAGAAAALVLTSCSDDGSDDTPATTDSTATTAPALTTAPTASSVSAEVGEDISEDGVTWTIHSISRDAECDYGSAGQPEDSFDLVQFRAEVHNRHASDPFVFDPTDVVAENGESLEWPDDMQDSGGYCEPVPGDDGYINWDDEVAADTQTFVYGAFAVPENTEFMSIRGHTFAIPEDYIDDVQGPDDEAGPEPTEGETPAEPQGESQSIWAPTGEPDPATVPIPDGGTCPAAICGYGHDEHGNPNPSSGELQTQHGCEEGYVTDPELCAAVGRPLG
ncbi:hypothetical protein [Corynebacterium glyciniphilum]|uniref:hypothetical protein n=1 Tax=Corynebacterium glyciniphilum TaxID=1404244 RepID=UPI0026565B68|nr:hypothetical protein [Corynebacterium glyciniphilum]MDN6706348.1 hypothetical protein [Corynebacterium glyciniphilum]